MDAGKRRLFDLHSLKAKSSPRSSPWTAENKIRHRAQSVIVKDKEMVNVHNALLDTMEATRKSNEWSSIIPEVILGNYSSKLILCYLLYTFIALLGCLWWSVVCNFPTVIFHSTLVEKNPTGCELLALCYLSPLFVSRSASLKRILNSPFGLLLTRLGLLLALFGYQTHHHVTRLSFVTIGNMFVPLMLQRLWWLTESLDR